MLTTTSPKPLIYRTTQQVTLSGELSLCFDSHFVFTYKNMKLAATIFKSLQSSTATKIICAFILCPCVLNIPHIYTLFTSPLIYLSFTSACFMPLQWKWIRNIWTTHNTGSQAQLEMPTGWIIMHSDPAEFTHHS
jgi:hypothetical protein